jgi:hypothetical protein
MKKIIVISLALLLPVFSYSQSGEPIFSVNNGVITPHSQFVDDFTDSQLVDTQTYTLSNPVNFQIGDAAYVVRTAKFEGWVADPGYNVLEISRNNQIVFVHRQGDGLVNLINDGLYGQSLRKYSDNDFFIKAPLSDTSTALIFPGWPYGTSPAAQLLIIVITPTDVKMVYNKNMSIRSATQSGCNFSMVLHSTTPEVGFGTPLIHTIYQQDGVLFFKNN